MTMIYLQEAQALMLIEEARQASLNTYSPYSNYPVGAAVLTKSGNIYRGTNIENASYGVTICAERLAIGNALSHADHEIIAIGIYANTNSISPCGACRQFIIEFGKGIIIVFKQDNEITQRTIGDLLHFIFTKDTME